MTAPYWSNGVATLYQADARAIPLPDGSVHCCITSPPYWGLRDYGLSGWDGGDPECGHARSVIGHSTSTLEGGIHNANSNGAMQGWHNGVCGHCGATQQAAGIGLEPTLSDWLANIVAVSREVWRVLRDDGTYWLNLGDAYTGSGKGKGGTSGIQYSSPSSEVGRTVPVAAAGGWESAVDGLPAKNLMGQPWRAAFALQDDGWILRSAIVWHKPNPMPESVSDRPTSAYEMVFLLTKRAHYFYDQEATREPQSLGTHARFAVGAIPRVESTKHGGSERNSESFHKSTPDMILPNGRNSRNVWAIPTQGRPEAHFATFPDELPRRCILAGTSEHGVCADCGAPWARQTEHTTMEVAPSPKHVAANRARGGSDYSNVGGTMTKRPTSTTVGWQPTCTCDAKRLPATVLDPFIGSGTTVAVAQQLGRHGIGLDLNPDYLAIAAKRLAGITLPMAI